MKKIKIFTHSAVLTVAILFSAYTFVAGNVLTVCNNSISAGQYTSLATAISAANAGDTIYVMGSAFDYGSTTISKQITLIGAGYNPTGTQFGSNTTISNITLKVNGSASAAGTRIMGVYSTNITSDDTNERNVTISRCAVTGTITIIGTNWLVENCVAGNISLDDNFYGHLGLPVACIISNNLIINNTGSNGSYGININGANVLINHNIIEGQVYEMSYTVISNNIFFHGNQSASTSCTFDDFNNNITVNSPKDSIPYGSNSGANNIYNPSTLFVSGPSSGQTYPALLNYNWALSASSPGHSAATDGTDIGIYGGSTPMPNMTGATTLPQLTYLNVNNAVTPVGGKLNINFKARTQN